MDYSTPGFPVHHQFLELTQTHVHQVGDAIQPSHSLSYPSPPAFNLSQHQGLFQWVSSSHQMAKVLEFQLRINPSNAYSGLISFRIDWFDLLAVQGAFKSLLQHHSSKASVVLCLKSLSTQRRLLPWTPVPAPWSIKYLNFQEKVNYFWSHTNLVNMQSAEEWFIRK